MNEYLIWSMIATGFMLGASASIGVLYILMGKNDKYKNEFSSLLPGIVTFALLIFILAKIMIIA